MTDKEIIKALECCRTATCISNNCPYEEMHDIPSCFTELSKDALDLINRQQAENQNLKGHLEQLKLRYDNAQAEIERLESKKEVLIDNYQNLIDRYIEAKAEAIKEFAERLKEHLKGYGGLYCVTTMNAHIDNLVKEMVGEDK